MPPAIAVENVSKRYRLGLIGGGTLREDVQRWWAKLWSRPDPLSKIGEDDSNVENGYIWALRDINFSVPEGEVLGVIGPNGAGKSTLLKVLTRITAPTSGEIRMRGRVASMLEVGTGFHPELTGRENVYLNGAILGMTKADVDVKFDEIVDFSGVGKYIETPIKRYSSGMKVRLAFAVAAHLEPEILLIDEVLAVGDAGFQKRCLGKMEEVRGEGRTVLFVSHDMGMINSLCERAILLSGGRIDAEGTSTEVVARYLDSFLENGGDAASEVEFPIDQELPMQLLAIRLCDIHGQARTRYDLFEPMMVEIDYVVRRVVEGAHLTLNVLQRGEHIFSTWDTDTRKDRFYKRERGHFRARIAVPAPLLKAGTYELTSTVGIANVGGIHKPEAGLTFEVFEESAGTSLLSYAKKRPGRFAVSVPWDITALSTAELNLV